MASFHGVRVSSVILGALAGTTFTARSAVYSREYTVVAFSRVRATSEIVFRGGIGGGLPLPLHHLGYVREVALIIFPLHFSPFTIWDGERWLSLFSSYTCPSSLLGMGVRGGSHYFPPTLAHFNIRATADHDVNIPFRLYADW